ncbi:MAG: ATP-binding cassette domain-containing protein [Candidatus Microgenomates bacterium]
MIFVKNLTKIYKIYKKTGHLITDLFFRKYKDLIALDNVSFEIDSNEIVGFIGPNGAGKTTTLKILSGILYPTNGQVKVEGFIPFEKKKEFLRQISFVMGQKSQLFWDLPAIDTFLLNKEIYEIKDDNFKKTLNHLTEILNCTNLINKPVKMLSLGERMKMEFIAALLHTPKIVFLDEPTIGLDIFSQEAIRNFIKNYQKEYQATIIFTSHYLEDVKKIAKRLIIINQGKIIYNGKLADIVNKFSQSKYVSLTLEKPIEKKDLEKIAPLINYQYPKVVFEIKKSELPEKISLISQKIPYLDITIEEEKIEEIIKKIYKK